MTPAILYKYREDSDRTENIVRDRKIWLSTPEKLNDPVECKTGIIPEDWKERTIREMEVAQLMGVIGVLPGTRPETLFSLDRQQTKKWLKRLKKLPHDRKVKEMRVLYEAHGIQLSNPKLLFETLQKQLSNVGIFSMSEKTDDQPMWAHYASEHYGLALGFSAAESSKLADVRHTLPVIYSAEKPTFSTGFLNKITIYAAPDGMASKQEFSFDDPVFRASITTKPPEWSYEREWRYVEEHGGLYDYPGELASVIFGCRMPAVRREYYKSLLEMSGHRVDLYEAVISSAGSFDVRCLPT
jgi:hypothetical protein